MIKKLFKSFSLRLSFLLVFLALQLSAGAGEKLIRVLAIGNSFSEDAVENNLHELGMAQGTCIVVGNLYIGGCPLQRHWKNAETDAPAYRYRKVKADGSRQQLDNTPLSTALKDEPWDYISMQQASGYSGQYETFEPYLKNLIAYVKKLAPRAKIIWHETWAYQHNSTHGAFPSYGCNQTTMFNRIVEAAQQAMKDNGIKIVVPSGTAIQDARTTFIGDNMNRDGYHLNKSYGRYTAACTWVETLTGKSVVGNSYKPQGVSDDLARAAQLSAHAAVQNPWKVTDLSSVKATTLSYTDPTVPVDLRVQDLLSKMTLEEKIMQLNQYTLGRNDNKNNVGKETENIPAEIGSLIYFGTDPALRNAMQQRAMNNSRLHIPIVFAFDVIHGFRTVFPIPLAQACSFNTSLSKLSCSVAAQEARSSGIEWTFSPMIDVSRDPRWGRIAESYGEDPYVNAAFATAAVQGYQGKSLADSLSIAACLKHYIGYGASEAGRDYVYTEISRQSLWDTYIPPYRAGISAKAASVMSSFNNFSGIPVTANRYLLHDVLRYKLGFQGPVVSDWGAIAQLKAQRSAADLSAASMQAMNAGVDIDMMSHAYDTKLKALVDSGKVSLTTIDDATSRVLKMKFNLGLFEHPYTAVVADSLRFLRPESKALAEQLAEESIVLLKNDNNMLPLNNIRRLAVVGPLATVRHDLLGCWWGRGRDRDIMPLLDAIKNEFGDRTQINYARGCDFDGSDQSGFKEAVKLASKSDAVVLCLGEKGNWSGENQSRASIALPDVQLQLLNAIHQTGKPVIVVLSNGRPMDLHNVVPLADAIVEMWQPGIAGGTPVARILSGKVNPSGRLAATFPLTLGQVPVYSSRRPSARATQGLYHDIDSQPLYPFGYGLSYTTFRYGKPVVSRTSLSSKDSFTIDVPVTNTGSCDGKLSVLGFIQAPYSLPTRPGKELRFFDKKEIKQGQTVVFHFKLKVKNDLGFVDETGNTFVTPGTYRLLVGDQKCEVTVK
jgi:beta-glucosidase